MHRRSIGLLRLLALPCAFILCAGESQAAPKKKKTSAAKTSINPSKATPKSHSKPTKFPKAPAKPPAQNSANSGAASSAERPSSSLVKNAPGAARRWITPLMRYESKLREGQRIDYDYQVRSTIHVINPDTEASLRLRLTCYDTDGAVAGSPIDKTILPMAAATLTPPRDQMVWCHLTTSIPSVAYLSLYHFRRHTGKTPDTVTEQKVVPLFKAQK